MSRTRGEMSGPRRKREPFTDLWPGGNIKVHVRQMLVQQPSVHLHIFFLVNVGHSDVKILHFVRRRLIFAARKHMHERKKLKSSIFLRQRMVQTVFHSNCI